MSTIALPALVAAKSKLPRGPRAPAVVQVAEYFKSPVEHLERCQREFGSVFTLRWPGMPPMVYFTELAAIREIFDAPSDVLCAGRSNAVLDFIAGPRSVARLGGAEHRRRRKALSVPFNRIGPAYASTMREQTVAAMNVAAQGTASFAKVSQSIALHNLLACALGVGDPETADKLHDLMLTFVHDSLNPVMATAWVSLPGVPLRKALLRWLAPLASRPMLRRAPFVRLASTIYQLDQHLYALIARARAAALHSSESGSVDILSLLLASADEGLTNEDLRDELMGLLVAGHETTGTTMSWVVVEALNRPEVLEKIVAEIDSVVGSGPVECRHLPQLKYLDAVIQECMRLHAPVPATGRLALRHTVVAGVPIPEGHVVSPAISLLQRDPAIWGDPMAFRPERYLDGSASRAAQIPFGGGVRTCIGRRFALFQLQVVLATIFGRFTLEPQSWPTTKQVQRGLFTGPSHPLRVVVRERI